MSADLAIEASGVIKRWRLAGGLGSGAGMSSGCRITPEGAALGLQEARVLDLVCGVGDGAADVGFRSRVHGCLNSTAAAAGRAGLGSAAGVGAEIRLSRTVRDARSAWIAERL
jgi:hypothetical protein